MAEQRYIKNPMPDYAAFVAKQRAQQAPGDVKYISSADYAKRCREIRGWLHENVGCIQKAYPPGSTLAPASVRERSERDFSIYVGSGGNAYLHWKLSRFFEAEAAAVEGSSADEARAKDHCQKAVEAIKVSLSLLPSPRSTGISFYIGNAGVHALAAAIYWSAGDHSKSESQLQQLLSFLPYSLHSSAADEVLYGKAGYLSSLLFARRHVGEELVASLDISAALRKVFDALVESGKQEKSNSRRPSSALQYHFYGVDYFGAAHGSGGILYILLQFPEWCKEPSNDSWIRNTLDRLLSFQMPSGNFASASDSRTDNLVHWCHGAPGMVYTLYKAYKVYGEARYKQALARALKSVWQRGILKKGLGTCHGTAGNAYAFLNMYRYTGVEEYYYSAMKMAEFMVTEEVKQEVAAAWDSQRHRPGVPDFPYSLMEGLGGTICFHCDLLHPEMATFPGYDGDL